MTLVGAFQVAHFESFINGQYEISTILMWSPKNENRVLSLLKGEDIYVEPGNLSLNDYIKSSESDVEIILTPPKRWFENYKKYFTITNFGYKGRFFPGYFRR